MADSIAVRARPIKKTLPSRCAAAWYRATQERRPLAEAVLFSVALSLLFVLVYGGCNALASRRTDLGVCFFAWELRIPFVPAFIVPYFVHVWFALIIASPLFTWQHHLLDVASGAMLAQVCLFAFPERPDRDRSGARGRSAIRALVVSEPNLRVARFYAIGSAALGILAIALGSWFCLLLWPAASLALISIAYVRGNSSVFRKANGRLPISTRVVLGPYLSGAFARVLIYRPRCEPWAEAAPRVYCGRLLTKREALAMRVKGLTGVLDLTAEHAETRAFLEIDYLNTAARKLQEIAYLNVPVLDLTAPSQKQLDAAVAFIAEHARRGGVYVHCALGISRSVAAVTAYIASQRAEPLLNYECADFPARERVTKISATSCILP